MGRVACTQTYHGPRLPTLGRRYPNVLWPTGGPNQSSSRQRPRRIHATGLERSMRISLGRDIHERHPREDLSHGGLSRSPTSFLRWRRPSIASCPVLGWSYVGRYSCLHRGPSWNVHRDNRRHVLRRHSPGVDLRRSRAGPEGQVSLPHGVSGFSRGRCDAGPRPVEGDAVRRTSTSGRRTTSARWYSAERGTWCGRSHGS